MRPRASLAAAALLAMLAGCGTVPLGSLPSLARIDAQTTDLGALRVALRLPDAISPLPGGVKLQVVVKISDEPDRETAFELTPDDMRSGASEIAAGAPGTSLYVFRFTTAEAGRFEALRASILAKKGSGKSGSLGIGIAATEFCRNGTLPDGPLLVTTYLRTSETGGFVEASRNLDLRGDPRVSATLGSLSECPRVASTGVPGE